MKEKTRAFTVRLTESQLSNIKIVADKYSTSEAQIIRWAIEGVLGLEKNSEKLNLPVNFDEANSKMKRLSDVAGYKIENSQTNDIGLTALEDGHTVQTLKANCLNPRYAEDAELWFSLTPEKVKELTK